MPHYQIPSTYINLLNPTKKFNPKYPFHLLSATKKLNKLITIRARCGTLPTLSHFFTRLSLQSPICPFCNSNDVKEQDNITHTLFFCDYWNSLRQTALDKLINKLDNINPPLSLDNWRSTTIQIFPIKKILAPEFLKLALPVCSQDNISLFDPLYHLFRNPSVSPHIIPFFNNLLLYLESAYSALISVFDRALARGEA